MAAPQAIEVKIAVGTSIPSGSFPVHGLRGFDRKSL
jgi:hypothetical protein